MHVATIVRDNKNGRLYVRYGSAPKTGGNVKLIETLNDPSKDALRQRADEYVKTLKETGAT